MKEGELFTLPTDKASTDVLISRYLANLLGLKVGDSFLTYFVQDEVRARKFHITGIYETGFVDYDKLFVIADIRQIRRLNGWAPDEVSGLELQVADYDHWTGLPKICILILPRSRTGMATHIIPAPSKN